MTDYNFRFSRCSTYIFVKVSMCVYATSRETKNTVNERVAQIFLLRWLERLSNSEHLPMLFS